jgi:hypothetical protein
MPTASAPIRIDDEIDTAARHAAQRMSRSVAEQVSHWARLGRELERSPDVSVVRVRSVLSGRRSYDALTAPEQAIVRTEWQAGIEQRLASLNLAHTFVQRGHIHAELSDQGKVTLTTPPAPVARRRARGT